MDINVCSCRPRRRRSPPPFNLLNLCRLELTVQNRSVLLLSDIRTAPTAVAADVLRRAAYHPQRDTCTHMLQ